jgi:hypothetical protein
MNDDTPSIESIQFEISNADQIISEIYNKLRIIIQDQSDESDIHDLVIYLDKSKNEMTQFLKNAQSQIEIMCQDNNDLKDLKKLKELSWIYIYIHKQHSLLIFWLNRFRTTATVQHVKALIHILSNAYDKIHDEIHDEIYGITS